MGLLPVTNSSSAYRAAQATAAGALLGDYIESEFPLNYESCIPCSSVCTPTNES